MTTGTMVGWVQIILLYTWLGAAAYIFYRWAQMCQSFFRSLETITVAATRVTGATDEFSQGFSGLLDKAATTLSRLEAQFLDQEVNPLLSGGDTTADESAFGGEKYKIE